jgi:hypothetical protein
MTGPVYNDVLWCRRYHRQIIGSGWRVYVFVWSVPFVITCIYREEFEDTKRGNNNPYIEEQTTQWTNEKVQKDKQRSTKYRILTIQ